MNFYLCLSHRDRAGDHKAPRPPSHAAESGVASSSSSRPGTSHGTDLHLPAVLRLSKKLKEGDPAETTGADFSGQNRSSVCHTCKASMRRAEITGRNTDAVVYFRHLLRGKNACQGSSKHKHTKHAPVRFVKLISKHKHTRAITNCKRCSVQGFSSLFTALLLLASAERYENPEFKSLNKPQKSRDAD